MQVVAFAFEEVVGLNAAGDDEVARGSSAKPRLAKTCDTQLLRIANTSRHFDCHALTVGYATLPFAFGTRIVDRTTCAATRTARGGRTHIAEERPLHRHDTTAAAALGA